MNKREKDAIFAGRIPGTLQYHQNMLSDGIRNELIYRAIKQYVTAETHFLDVGAGVGVWAILAAKLGAKRVVAIEIEECLIPFIYKLARENEVADKIEIIHANCDDVRLKGKFNLIVSEVFGNNAMSPGIVNSFIRLRERYLAEDGVLIPQKLSLMAVPVKTDLSVQNMPSALPFECEFIKSIKRNYPRHISKSERDLIKISGTPKSLAEIEFLTASSAPVLNFSNSWEIEDLSEVDGIILYNHSSFTKDITMDSFNSQSWGSTLYEFKPPEIKQSGIVKFDLSLDGENMNWTISFPSISTEKAQGYSPVFPITRLRMAQKSTPFKKYTPNKSKVK